MSGLVSLTAYQGSKIILDSAIDGTYSAAELQAFIDRGGSHIESQLYQGVLQTARSEVYRAGTQLCSVGPDGYLNIFPRNTPIISVTGISWRTSPGIAWADAVDFLTTDWSIEDALGTIVIPANPFVKGQFGELQLTYSSGYAPKSGSFSALLTSAAAVGATSIAMNAKPLVGMDLQIDTDTSTTSPEIRGVTAAAGASTPFTVTLDAPLTLAHASGAAVALSGVPLDLQNACIYQAAIFASAGYAGVNDEGVPQRIIPKWMWDEIQVVFDKYRRRF